ncbi:MAG: NAD-binding protein, partial [Anaerolineae bacterium]|nr:NAD-binding protein [Anaerolineae bacterium]
MKIIIAGAGEVGFYLSKMLAQEHHDVIVIDTNRDVLGMVEAHTDLMTIEGSATSINTLLEAGVESTELLIAVTQSEEVNLVTAALGKQLGAQKTIARVENFEYVADDSLIDFTLLGVDSVISPSALAVSEIEWLIKRAAARNAFEFEGGKLTLLEMTIQPTSPVGSKTVSEVAQMYPRFHFRIVAIVRNAMTIIPTGDTQLHRYDLVFIIADTQGIDQINEMTGNKDVQIRDIMILGGSKLG